MNKLRNSKVRRVLLGFSGAAFLVVAAGSLVSPRWMAEGLGYFLTNTNALNEFRAVYVGLWLAHVALVVIAIVKIDRAAFGDVAAMLILGQTVGRVISIVLDGFPSPAFLPLLTLEPLAGLAILIVRPSSPSDGETRGQLSP